MLLVSLPFLILLSNAVSQTPTPAPPFYANKARLLVYLDAQAVEQAVRTPADWGIRRSHILANMQLVMGPLPNASPGRPLDPHISEVTDEGTYLRKKVTLAVEDGDRLPGWLLVPKTDGPRPAVLCLHQTIAIGKDEPAGLGDNDELDYARELARRGYVTLSVDYPNFGDYHIDAYDCGYQSATMKGIFNHMRAVDYLAGLAEVDPDRIGCMGHSLGGHNSLFLAAFDSRIRCVASSCGFGSFPTYQGGDLSGWSHNGYMPRIKDVYHLNPREMPFDFPEVLAAIAPRGVFVCAPTGDSNFDVQGVRDCVTAAGPIFALLGAREKLVADHPEAGHEFPAPSRMRAYEFFDRILD
jgi:pimeloyl-ACP methyl ester carboxylesterase